MVNKPSRKKRKLARERNERAKQHDLPAAAFSAPPARARVAASALGDAGRSGREGSNGDEETNGADAESSSTPASSGPRPNLLRRLPAGAKLGIILALALALVGVIIALLRSG
jgi:hypothetical protein